MKITLKYVLIIVLVTCKTSSIKPCINRESKIKISQLSHSVTIFERKMKFLAVVTPTSIYQI